MATTDAVDERLLSKAKGWENYLQARLGFRNHWYPVRFSHEIAEGKPVALKALGEPMLVKRIDGQVYAIRDRCIHRGVQISAHLECYTKTTVTCWYHGFTYRFSDGLLVDAVGAPGTKLIGRRYIRSFPVAEAKGVVFIFVGDEGRTPPPLSDDIPPGFLDDSVVVRGIHRDVASSWRIGAENGYDSGHIYLHRNSEIVPANSLRLPVSIEVKELTDDYFIEYVSDSGPKGVSCARGPAFEVPHFEGTIEGEVVVRARGDGKKIVAQHTSMWLPCCLKVDPWPDPEMAQFEWYTPIDEDHHLYFQTLAFRAKLPEDEARFHREFDAKWMPLALVEFNDEDILARVAMQKYYADDTAWIDEQLSEHDLKMMRWRKFASKHARGVQRREHLR